MTESVIWMENVVIVRDDANFDRACDQAFQMALINIGFNEEDDTARYIPCWDSTCIVATRFQFYERYGSRHRYVFEAYVTAKDEDDEDE